MANLINKPLLVDWNLLSVGPCATYHIGCIVSHYLYIHGGIKTKQQRRPNSSFHRYDLDTNRWENITCDESPALSHHSCVVFENRYITIIGGWNGMRRVSNVVVYDTEEKTWRPLKTEGFSDQGGLSSHTTTLLKNKIERSILVIGREGSLHMQRRYGNGYILKIDYKNNRAVYDCLPITLDSRSGHTTTGYDKSLYIIGGRDNKFVDNLTIKTNVSLTSGDIADTITQAVKTVSVMKIEPVPRKFHQVLPITGGLFMYGGDTFRGRERDPVGDFFYLRMEGFGWFSLGCSEIGLTGHVMVSTNGRILMHGGEGAKCAIHGDVYELVGTETSKSKKAD